MEKIDRATHVLKIDGDRGEVVLQMRSLPLSQVWRPLMYVELHPWQGNIKNDWFP